MSILSPFSRGVDHAKSLDTLKTVMKKFEAGAVQRIDVCPNDCIAYWDSTYLPELYKNYYRTKCPVCSTSRLCRTHTVCLHAPSDILVHTYVHTHSGPP